MKGVALIPRIKCECGWYNNKPAKENEKHARCSKCGKNTIKEYRKENRLAEFRFELNKNLYKLRQKC